MPTAPPLIYYGKKSGDGFFGLLLNMAVFAALVGLVWWFYQAMKKNASDKKTEQIAPAPEMAPPMAEAPPPPPEPEGAGPSDVGAEVESS